MTPQEIDELPAGRELDALVAEHVMDWFWFAFQPAHNPRELVRRIYPPTAPERNFSNPIAPTIPLAQGWDSNLPHYSTDIAAAWVVEDEMMRSERHAERYLCRLLYLATGLGFGITTGPFISFLGGNTIDRRWKSMELLKLAHATPEMRCRAALKSVL